MRRLFSLLRDVWCHLRGHDAVMELSPWRLRCVTCHRVTPGFHETWKERP